MDFRYKSYRPYGPIQFITSITSTVNLVVNLPNGHKAVVMFIGTVQLTTTLSLQNVLCVPTFSFDLVSISQLTKNLTCLIFLDTLCFIQGLHPWRTVGLGKAKGNLYLLDTSINSFPSFSIPAFASNVSCVNKISAAAMPANELLQILVLLVLLRINVKMYIYGMPHWGIPPFLGNYFFLIVFLKLL